jgi:hypothetical protein
MLKNRLLLTLFGTFLFAISVLPAQEPVFDPWSGKTVYRTNDGGIVVYTPTLEGSEVDVITGKGDRTTVDCQEAPETCKDVLKDAADGTPPFIPEEPTEGGEEGGGEASTQSGSQSTQIWKEFKQYSKANKGKMYYRSKSGKWYVIKDWQGMHKLIMGGRR